MRTGKPTPCLVVAVRETAEVSRRGRTLSGMAHRLNQFGIRKLLVEVAQVQLVANCGHDRCTVAFGLELAPVNRTKERMTCFTISYVTVVTDVPGTI